MPFLERPLQMKKTLPEGGSTIQNAGSPVQIENESVAGERAGVVV